MNSIIARALTAGALGVAVSAGTAVSAGAAVSPPPGVVRVQANNNGWAGMSYRPGTIFVGNGCAPFVSKISWGSWNSSVATTSAGTLHQCGSGRPASVYLHDVKVHGAQKYFAKMRWTWTSGNGTHRVEYWRFRVAGGTVPFWNHS